VISINLAQDRPSTEQVREELTRLLECPYLDASARVRDLLRYIVEETLAGRSERLSEAAIAISVFGRGDDFDALQDPIVGVQVARLRRALERCYLISGDSVALRIELPKGGLRCHVRPVRSRAESDRRRPQG
jgi:adenylate cyclase